MSKQFYFVIALAIIVVGFLLFMLPFEHIYHDGRGLELKVQQLIRQKKQKDLQLALKQYEIETLKGRQQQRLPAALESNKMIIFAQSKLSEIKTLFNQGKCNEVVDMAQAFEQKYSFHEKLAEVILLKADCYYRNREYELALLTFAKLIDAYPEAIETALAILKMAEILQILGRDDESFEILKIIERHFVDQKEILNLARELANKIGRKL